MENDFQVVCVKNHYTAPSSMFFYQPQHLSTFYSGSILWRIDVFRAKTKMGQIYFVQENDRAISLPSATFGGFEAFVVIHSDEWEQIKIGIEDALRKNGFKQVIIKNQPSYGQKIFDWPGQNTQTETNQHIEVTDSAFEDIIHTSKKRKLAKLRQVAVFEEIIHPDFEAIHAIIEANRLAHRRPVSLSLESLKLHAHTHKENFKPFCVKISGQMAAVAWLVRFNPQIAYVFMPADLVAFEKHSPTILLIEGLYAYCQHNHISILDYGISSENGVLNEGLFAFKQMLGAKASEKLTFNIGL